MTRATLHLVSGDLAGALHIHPLAPFVLLAALLLLGPWLRGVLTGRAVPPPLRARPTLIVALTLIVWIVNLRWGTG